MNLLAKPYATSVWSLFSNLSFGVIVLFAIFVVRPFYLLRGDSVQVLNTLGFLFVNSFFALMFALTAKELMSKPFTYCLPNSGKAMRRHFIVLGIAINAIYAICAASALSNLAFPVSDNAIKAGLAIFFLGFSYYILLGYLCLKMQNTQVLFILLMFVIIVLAGNTWDQTLRQLLELSMQHPFMLSIFPLLLLLLFYFEFEKPQFYRNKVGAPVLGFIVGLFNSQKSDVFEKKLQLKKNTLRSDSAGLIRLNAYVDSKTKWGCFGWDLVFLLESYRGMTPVWVSFIGFLGGLLFLVQLNIGSSGDDFKVFYFLSCVPFLLTAGYQKDNRGCSPLCVFSRLEQAKSHLLINALTLIVGLAVLCIIVLSLHLYYTAPVTVSTFKLLLRFPIFLPIFLASKLYIRNAKAQGLFFFVTIVVYSSLLAAMDATFLVQSYGIILLLNLATWIPYILLTYRYFLTHDLHPN